MPLQNRVRPDGVPEVVNARGMFTGNRGIIHDPDTKQLLGRRWTVKAWICCALRWKDRSRDVWGRNHTRGDGSQGTGWSELFFLDEVTALAAGHRPCHVCRRDNAIGFKTAFRATHDGATVSEIDTILHRERRLSARSLPQELSAIDLPGLPDGSVVETDDGFFALKQRQALPWSHTGYGRPQGLGQLARRPVRLVTPRSMLNVLRHGYTPAWHASAA